MVTTFLIFRKGGHYFFMPSQDLLQTYEHLQRLIEVNGINFQYIETIYQLANVSIEKEKDVDFGLSLCNTARTHLEDYIQAKLGADVFTLDEYCKSQKIETDELKLWWKIVLLQAQNRNLDAYLLYIEKNREAKDKFYKPRRKCFLKIGLIQALQDLIDGKLDVLSISLPPGTGKTTLEKFFHTAVCGWFPEDYNLFFSHSAGITRMYYDGVLDILTNNSEYTWDKIFPNLSVTSTNAKMEQINIGTYKPFPNVQTGTVGSELAGRCRCSKFLFVDDLIGKLSEALNKNILESLWAAYSTDARQRKVTGCRELILGTRWSVHDHIGRLQTIYADNDRCKFIAYSDIDEETGKSNFLFEINGFTEEFYHDQELLMDEITYKCLYKNQPVEREGLLYHEDELRRYLSLPLREPDAIIGVCDTKAKGTDFFVLPVMYKYGEDYYMADCLCSDSSDFGVQYERMANLIMDHNMQQCEFESNTGGDRVAYEVENRINQLGGRCNITTKPTESNKETRIIVNSDWIKKHIIFKDKSLYSPKDDYGVFMSWLLTYSVAGKNLHDDVVDSLANFALYVTAGSRIAKVEAVQNPFRTGGYNW